MIKVHLATIGKFVDDEEGYGHSQGHFDGVSDGPSTAVVHIKFVLRGIDLQPIIGFVTLCYICNF